MGLIVVLAMRQTPLAAEDAGPQPFVPGEISVGEPIVLPSAPAGAGDGAVDRDAQAAAPAAVPGNGWLGLAVAESRTPGRWTVAEVVPGSPSAIAGIRVGDDIRAINGTLLRSADDVAQSLTAIAPGQPVSVAVARDEVVADVRMTAVPRPAPQPVRGWQAAPTETAAPAADRYALPPPPAADPIPPPQSPAPASIMVPPAFAATPPTLVAPPAPDVAPTATVEPAVPFAAVEPAPAFAPSVDRATLPQPPVAAVAPGGRGRTALGVRTVPIDPGTQSRFRLPAAQGAYVVGVVHDLPAARAGLPPGSVIVALDQRPVGSPDDLARMVTSGPVGRPVSLEYVLPGGEAKKAEVVLQPLELPLERALVGPDPTAAAAGAPALLPGPSVPPPSPPATFPYRSNRPLDARGLEATRAEIRRLRAQLEALERAIGRD